jgi:hypothetical protein
MNIKHKTVFKDTDKIVKFYSEKDGVPVKYVLTSDTTQSDRQLDIFYRDTPHPKFGNHYFGVNFGLASSMYISNADMIEDTVICCVEGDDGQLEYSQSHHDYKHFINGNMIDGGRVYARYIGKPQYFKVKNGVLNTFVPDRLSIKNDNKPNS